MNEKILTADLVNAVAEATNIPKNRCDDFVKAFFEAIANALAIDGVVKVKGLGSFKLISVEERKSVNVQNGAEMIIPAHVKVSFTPDKSLKDEINKPYAHLKTYVLNPNAPLDPPEPDDEDVVEDVTADDSSQSENLVSESSPVENLAVEATIPSISTLEQSGDSSQSVVASGSSVVTEPSVSDSSTDVSEPSPLSTQSGGEAESGVLGDSSVATGVSESASSADVPEFSPLSTQSGMAPVSGVGIDSAVVGNPSVSNIEQPKIDTSSSVNNAVGEPFNEKDNTLDAGLLNNRANEGDDAKESEGTDKTVSSHSDWFDNWEVEYEAEGGTIGDLNKPIDKDKETPVFEQPQVSMADEVAASFDADIDRGEIAVDKDKNENNTDVSSDESQEEVQGVHETVKTEIPENGDVAAETKEMPAAETNLEQDLECGKASEKEECIAENTESAQLPDAENPESNTVRDLNTEPEKVQHGKVLGVAIVTFIVLLVAAFFGLKALGPDFFRGLKASSDNPPVMPNDTVTTLEHELSVYVPEADSTETPLEADNADGSYADDGQSVADGGSDVAPVSDAVDPLWNGEFVAYMKRQHKDVSLATSGLIGETTIKPGLFLTMVALQNYGDKAYWIYLYLYNTDRIKNPNNVPVGTKIRVPKLDETLVNGPSDDQLNLAKEVRLKFVK